MKKTRNKKILSFLGSFCLAFFFYLVLFVAFMFLIACSNDGKKDGIQEEISYEQNKNDINENKDLNSDSEKTDEQTEEQNNDDKSSQDNQSNEENSQLNEEQNSQNEENEDNKIGEEEQNQQTLVVDESFWGNLPVIKITTQDNALPYDKETYINCSFSIENAGDYNLDVEMKQSADKGCGIRLRGNSTRYMPKKPYRIKFAKKQSVLGLAKAKNWCLLADYIDQSSIRNYATLNIGSYFDGLDFVPTPNHVVLFINETYQGLYLLTEKIDEKTGRVDIEEDELIIEDGADYPFLIEINDGAYYDADEGDVFEVEGMSNPFEIQYPEKKDRPTIEEEDVIYDYIKAYVSAMWQTVSNHEKTVEFNGKTVTFSDLVDVNSMIDFFLVNEIARNYDVWYKSCYFHKSKDGKVVFGPIWDFDWTMTNAWTGEPYIESSIYVANSMLCKNICEFYKEFLKDEYNYKLVQERWNLVYPKLIDKETGINTLLKNYKETIRQPAFHDADKWYGEHGRFEFDFSYDYVRLFLIDRLEFLNNSFKLSYEDFMKL